MPSPTHTESVSGGAGQCHWHHSLGFLLRGTAPAPCPQSPFGTQAARTHHRPCLRSPTAHQLLLLEMPSMNSSGSGGFSHSFLLPSRV